MSGKRSERRDRRAVRLTMRDLAERRVENALYLLRNPGLLDDLKPRDESPEEYEVNVIADTLRDAMSYLDDARAEAKRRRGVDKAER